MYDLRDKIIELAEDTIHTFTKMRLLELDVEDDWKNGLKSFVDSNYPSYQSNYEKLYTFLQTHDETEVILEQLDITAISALILFYLDRQYGICDLGEQSYKLFLNHVHCLRMLRNTFDHYTQTVVGEDVYKFFYDQLYYSETLSSFALLVMKYKGPSEEWKSKYKKAKDIQRVLQRERWLSIDDGSSHIISLDEDFSDLVSAANQGNVDAMLKVGKALYVGERVQPDYEKAFLMFCRALLKGNPEAEYYISKCYKDGKGVCLDKELADKWLIASAEHGFADAQFDYGFNLYHFTEKKPENVKKAALFIKAAADQGHAQAIYTLGMLYHSGKGVPKNSSKGDELYKEAAIKGHDMAIKVLIEEAMKSNDYQQAIHWCDFALAFYKDAEHLREYNDKLEGINIRIELNKEII